MEFRRYWEILWKRKWVLIQAAVFVPLCVFILIKIVPPVYQSEGKIWIKMNAIQQQFVSSMPTTISKLDFAKADDAMGTMKEIMKSGHVVGKVISEMGLKDKGGKLIKRKKFINPNFLNLIIRRKGVRIEQVPDTETFDVIGYSDVSSEATEIANQTISRFLDVFAGMYREAANKALEILTGRVQEIMDKLTTSEKTLANYKAENYLLDIGGQVNTLISEISNLEFQLNATKRTLLANKDIRRTIKSALAEQPEFKEGQMTVEMIPVIEDYKKQLLSAETKLAMSKLEQTNKHPDVKRLEKQTEVIRNSLSEEIGKLFNSPITQRYSYYNTLVSRDITSELAITENIAIEKALRCQIGSRRRRMQGLSQKEKELYNLVREVENLRVIHNAYSSNIEAVRSAIKMDMANAVVIQSPLSPENLSKNMYFPPEKKGFALILSLLIGVFFGFCWVFFLEYIDEGVWDVKEIEEITGRKVIGILQKVKNKEVDINKLKPSSYTESIYNLLINMRLLKGGELGKFVSVISPSKGDGKSTLAAFIGTILAGQGKKSLLIDGNLRNPTLHGIFGLSSTRGLGEYLRGELSVKDAIVNTSIRNLDILPAGHTFIVHPLCYFDSSRFSKMLKDLAEKYDIVMLDTAAFEGGSEALAMSSAVDDVLVVASQGSTAREHLQKLSEDIAMARIKVLGMVLNKVRFR